MTEVNGNNGKIYLQKDSRVVDTNEIKGGIRRSEITDELQLQIFDALNLTKSTTGAADEMLDANEIKAFVDKLIAESGDDFKLGRRDINRILEALHLKGIKGLNKEKVFTFIEQLLTASGDVDTSHVTKDQSGNNIITTVYDNGVTERLNPDGTTELMTTDVATGAVTTNYLNLGKKITSTVTVNGEDKTTVSFTDANGNVVLDSEGNEVVTGRVVVNNGSEVLNESIQYEVDALGNYILDADGKPIPKKKVTVDNQTDIETTTTVNFNSGLAQNAIVERGAVVSTYLYDEQGQNPRLDNTVEDLGGGLERTTKIEYKENGQVETINEPGKNIVRTLQTFNTADGEQLLLPTEEIITEGTRVSTNKYDYTGQGATRTETIVDSNNSTTETNTYVLVSETNADGESIQRWAKLQQIKVVNGKTYQIQYDGNGNTPIVVQWNESPAAIAKKFGCSVDELFNANPNLVKGKGNRRYFPVGSEIVVPREVEADDTDLRGRLSREGAIAQYKRDQILRKEYGLVSYRGAGTKISVGGESFTVLGYKAGGNDKEGGTRMLVQYEKGEICTVYTGADGVSGVLARENDINLDYYYANLGNENLVREIDGGTYVVSNKDEKGNTLELTDGTYYRDQYKRQVVIDNRGCTGVTSGTIDPKRADGSAYILDNDYLAVHDEYMASEKTLGTQCYGSCSNIRAIEYKGKTYCFNQNGVQMNNESVENIVSSEIARDMQAAADNSDAWYNFMGTTWGTDEDLLAQATKGIHNATVYQGVNNNLTDERWNDDLEMSSAVEDLLRSEESMGALRGERGYYQHLVKVLPNEYSAPIVSNAIHHEIGNCNSESDVIEVYELVSDPELRRAVEADLEAKIKEQWGELCEPVDGSYIKGFARFRTYRDEEFTRIDATWVRTNAYEQAVILKDANGTPILDEAGNIVYLSEGDQVHRNAVIGTLLDYGDSESFQVALNSVNTDNFVTDGPSADYLYLMDKAEQVNNSRGFQAQIADQDAIQTMIAGYSVDGGVVESEQVNTYNNWLFNDQQPARVQAERVIYQVREGNLQHVFASSEPEVYTELNKILRDGDIEGCTDFNSLYKKASNDPNVEQNYLNMSAIASGKVEFSDEEIVNMCVNAMLYIQHDLLTLDHKEEKTALMIQLERAIESSGYLKDDILAAISAKSDQFYYDQYVFAGNDVRKNTSGDWRAIVNNCANNATSYTMDGVFYNPETGEQITDPAQIEFIKARNLKCFQEIKTLVAQMEREFELGLSDEGCLTSTGRALIASNVDGRLAADTAQDMRNYYQAIKTQYQRLQLAAEGKLLGADNKPISFETVAGEIRELTDQMASKNAAFKQTGAYAKMGVILAPVIIVSTAASGGAAAAGWGSLGVIMVGAGTTFATTYGLNTLEQISSRNGLTNEENINNLIEASVNGGLFLVGAQATKLAQMIKLANPAISNITKLSTVVTADTGAGMVGEYIITGEVTVEGTVYNAIFSAAGNLIALKSLTADAGAPRPRIPDDVKPGTVLDQATKFGSTPIGGKLGNSKFKLATGEIADEVAGGVTPVRHAQLIDEAGNLRGNGSRVQGRQIQHIVEDGTGVYHWKNGEIDLNTETDIVALQNFRKEVVSWDNTIRPKDDILARIDNRIAALEADPSLVTAGGSSAVLNEINASLKTRTDSWLSTDPNTRLRLGENHMPDLEARIARATTLDELDAISAGIKARHMNGTKIDLIERLNHAVNQRRIALRPDIDMDGFNSIITTKTANGKGLSEIETQDIVRLLQNCSDDEFVQIEVAIMASNKNIKKNKQILQALETRRAQLQSEVELLIKTDEDPSIKPDGNVPEVEPAIRLVADEPVSTPHINETSQRMFDDALNNSQLKRTTSQNAIGGKIGGSKFQELKAEFEQLSALAKTPEQLQQLENLAAKFNPQHKATFMEIINARRAKLAIENPNELYLNNHQIVLDRDPMDGFVSRPVNDPAVRAPEGAPVVRSQVDDIAGQVDVVARQLDDAAKQAVDDIDNSINSYPALKFTWTSCKERVNKILTYAGQLTDDIVLVFNLAMKDLDLMISTATDSLKTKLQSIKTTVKAKFDALSSKPKIIEGALSALDENMYAKIMHVQKFYPDLDSETLKKLVNVFKNTDEMIANEANIARWLKEKENIRNYASAIAAEGENGARNVASDIANMYGVRIPDGATEVVLEPGVTLSFRAKGVESIYDKLSKKVLLGKDLRKDGTKIIDLVSARENIGDLVGTRIVLDDVSNANIQRVVDKLCQGIESGQFKITEVHNYSKQAQKYFTDDQMDLIRGAMRDKGLDNEFKILDIREHTSASGYVTAQMNITHSNGILGELQIRGKRMNKYAEIEHIPYDIRMGKNIGKNIPELADLYKPVQDAVNKLKLNGLDADYDNYILECYQYIRKFEAGEIQGEFKLPEFPDKLKDYSILSFDNLDKIHEQARIIYEKYQK